MNFWRFWGKSKRTHKALLLLAAAVLALLAGFGAGRFQFTSQKTPEKAHEFLVEFALPDIHGKRRHIQEWQGRLILLNFWATWCAPCREEIPLLIRMQQRYAARGLQVIGIAVDSTDAVAAYQKDMQMDYPILVGHEAIEVAQKYGNRHNALPFNVLIGADGRILARKLGAYTAQELETLVYPNLKPKTP